MVPCIVTTVDTTEGLNGYLYFCCMPFITEHGRYWKRNWEEWRGTSMIGPKLWRMARVMDNCFLGEVKYARWVHKLYWQWETRARGENPKEDRKSKEATGGARRMEQLGNVKNIATVWDCPIVTIAKYCLYLSRIVRLWCKIWT